MGYYDPPEHYYVVVLVAAAVMVAAGAYVGVVALGMGEEMVPVLVVQELGQAADGGVKGPLCTVQLLQDMLRQLL